MVNILVIIVFVAIDKFVYVGSTVLDRQMRSIVRIAIFIYSLELLTVALVQYGLLPLFANFIALLRVFHFYISLIAAITISLLICYNFFYCSSTKEYEIGDYEDTEMCDDEENPEYEVH